MTYQNKKEEGMRIMLTKEEKQAIAHLLIEGRESISTKGGNQYGPLSLDQLTELISKLQSDEFDSIESYLEGRCPRCNIELVDSFCPECGEEWSGDEVLRNFY